MIRLFAVLDRQSRPALIAAGLAMLLLTGVVDYLTGFEMVFSVFYLLAVGLAAWFVGKGFGMVMSMLSAVVWIGGDLAAGATFSNPWIPVWNTLILMAFFFIVVWLLTNLRYNQKDLERRVHDRTRALTREMAERQRLEEEILKVSEREQQRIGHELHDSLCQHLTATALAGQVLGERLEARALPEAKAAGEVVALVEQGIDLARNLARGLYPVEMEAEGLMTAFQELAATISKSTKVHCVFECALPVLIHEDTVATHLYRIAQEAVRNALRHGKPQHIGISLSESAKQVRLSIEDDGIGLPDPPASTPGLGIRIMAHRAAMIGGTLSLEPAITGGTTVVCAFPKTPADHSHAT